MNFNEILLLKDKEPIDTIRGKVVGIYAKKATPGQTKAGIAPQDVVITDSDGVKIRLTIMSEGMHLPEDAKGRTFKFESTPDEKGKPSGLAKNVYGNYNTVQVHRDAVISGDKSAPIESKPQRAEGYAMPPEAEAPRGRADLGDHCHTLAEIIKMMDGELEGSELQASENYPDMLQKLATTVYIQASKEGLVKRRAQVPTVVVHMTEEAAPRPAVQEKKPEPAPAGPRLTVDQIVKLAVQGELDAATIESCDKQGGYDWEAIYDKYEAILKKDFGFQAEHVNSVYDELKASFTRRTKRFDNTAFCKCILCDCDTFKGSIADRASRPAQPAQAAVTPETDDIPF